MRGAHDPIVEVRRAGVAAIFGGLVAALLYTYVFTTPGKKGVAGMFR